MTRSQTKKANEAMNKLVQETMFVSSKEASFMLETSRDDKWINLIQAVEENYESSTFTAVPYNCHGRNEPADENREFEEIGLTAVTYICHGRNAASDEKQDFQKN